MSDKSGFRRAVLLTTATSLLIPLVGLVTAPVLALALGVSGRGEAAAAMAPNALIVSVATLGLPEALTFHLATRPWLTRRALGWTALVTTVLGGLSLLVVLASAGYLAGDDAELARLIVLGVALAIPMLWVNLLRGAAFGSQLWGAIATERIINSVLRVAALVGLAVADRLTVLTAVLVIAIAPIVGGFAYVRLLRPVATPRDLGDLGKGKEPVLSPLLGYGSRIWLGAVAAMVTGKLGPLLVTPLSDVQQLGLLVVATTIADVPFIVSTAVRDVLFGMDSRKKDPDRLATATRLSTLIALLGALALGIPLPWWIGAVFGGGFTAAVPATWLLLLAAVANVPGWMAGAGLGAWNRPALRSSGLVLALAVNLVALLGLVPPLGAVGAGIAAVLSAVTMSAFGVISASRIVDRPIAAFLLPHRVDIALLRAEVARATRRFRGPGTS